MGTVVHLTDQSLQLSAKNWDSVYSTVCSFSASWEETDSIVPIVTQYLSSNNVNLFTANVNDLYVLSSLFVLGTATFVNSESLTINDPVIYVAQTNQTDLLDIGLVGSWTNNDFQYGGLVRRADNKFWTLFSGITAQPLSGTNFNWTQPGVNLESLSANFYGDIFGNRAVYGNLNLTNNLTVAGNITANSLNVSFNQGTATGDYSLAENSGKAIGNYSHAEGVDTTAQGYASHTQGVSSIALGSFSHAEGLSSQALGNMSHAEGNTTIASGSGSHAEGQFSTASGNYSHAEGLSSQALGNMSHAEGEYTIAVGNYSHAEGTFTVARGDYSHAEGDSTLAEGTGSHAEGTSTIASGSDSHAEGNTTIASGDISHAEGVLSEAKNLGSHAAGIRATAGHNYSYIWSGNSTLVQNVSTTRTGQFMVSAPGGIFFPGSVGIGTDITSNALTVSGVIVARGGNSNLWNDAYTTINALTATGSTNLNTVASYLSTNVITLCSIDVRGQILSGGTNLLDIFSIQGIQGVQGTLGIQGVQGLSNQGVQGVQGLGVQGNQGIQGSQAAQGLQGVQGLSNQGVQGSQGLQGVQGLSNQGVQGSLGLQGSQGVQGNQGDQGSQGVQGVQGIQSSQGVQGSQGLSNQGVQGLSIQGNQGLQGLQGLSVQGSQGVQGLSVQGTQGIQGLQATQGNQGPQGIQGTLGTQGNFGIQGSQGLSNQGVQGNLGLQGNQGVQGFSVQGLQGNLGLQGNQGISNQGSQGVQGNQSAQGTQGLSIQGLQGNQGIQGILGIQGVQGVANQGTDLTTVTNYLSTNSVVLCSIDVRSQILSAGTSLFDIFVTTSSAIQTLLFNEASLQLSITQGNTISLSSINSTVATNSANWQSTYLTVSALSASWEESADIIPTVTNYLSTNNVLISSLSIINSLTAKEIFGQGTETIISDRDNVVGNGANTLTLNFLSGVYVRNSLNVVGSVSGSNLNISNWNSTFTNVQSNSAQWNSSFNISTAYQNASSSFLLQGGNSLSQTLSVGSNDNQHLVLETGSVNRVTILSSGNVGINTITPNERLTVVGNISATGTISTSNHGTSQNWNTAYQRVSSQGLNTTDNVQFANVSANNIDTWASYNNNDGGPIINVKWITISDGESPNYVQITDNGISFYNSFGVNTAANTRNNLGLGTAATLDSGRFALSGGNTNDSNLLIGTNDNFDLNLETANTTRMTITSTGNVGINTITPNERLTVVGNISATGNLTTNSNYVVTLQLTANQTANNAADTLVSFDPKNDPNNWFSRTAGVGLTARRVTPTIPGYYYVSYQLHWNQGTAGAGSQNNIQILKSAAGAAASTIAIVQQPINNSDASTCQTTNAITYMNGSTDYLIFRAYSSNAAQVIQAPSDGNWTKVEMFKIN